MKIIQHISKIFIPLILSGLLFLSLLFSCSNSEQTSSEPNHFDYKIVTDYEWNEAENYSYYGNFYTETRGSDIIDSSFLHYRVVLGDSNAIKLHLFTTPYMLVEGSNNLEFSLSFTPINPSPGTYRLFINNYLHQKIVVNKDLSQHTYVIDKNEVIRRDIANDTIKDYDVNGILIREYKNETSEN